jgi:hypothetical protein
MKMLAGERSCAPTMQIAHPSGGCAKMKAKGESKNHGNSIITCVAARRSFLSSQFQLMKKVLILFESISLDASSVGALIALSANYISRMESSALIGS